MTNDKIELLLKEYEDRREENAWHTQRYHKQSNFTYLYASVIIAISGVLSSNQELVKNFASLRISGESLNLFYLVLLSLAAMVGYYLFASTLDALFMLYVNGIRAAVIEKLINAEAKENILIWNSKILNYFFDSKLIRIKSWIKPPVLVIAWIFLFFLATNGLLCFLCYLMAREFFYLFSIPVLIFTLFHMYQLFALNNLGVAHIWSFVTQISGLTDNSSHRANDLSSANSTSYRPKIKNYWVPFTTIALGFLPMALLSIQTDSFLPTSPHPFPFLLNISTSLGNLLLVPIFNYFFYVLVFNNRTVLKRHSSRFIGISILLFLGSTYIQFLVHKDWTSDQYTGFMDLTLGQLSVAGWWHFGFASVETTIILLYLVIWFFSRNDKASFSLALTGWKYLCIYVSLGVIDLVVQLLTAFRSLPVAEIILLQWQIVLRLVVVFSVFFFSKKHLTRLI